MSPQAKQILSDARERYGKAWDLMSEDQQRNYLRSRVLMLLFGQCKTIKPEDILEFGQRVLFELENK
jgi:hypothetical protein